MLLCRDTSRILNTLAPRRAALVRNPARKECAPKSALVGSRTAKVPGKKFCQMQGPADRACLRHRKLFSYHPFKW
jgi:hypothetical protein